MKRYLVYPFDFDSRALDLSVDTSSYAEPELQMHNERVAHLKQRIKQEFGEPNFDRKVKDFADLGARPFSIVAHHNSLYHSACNAFVHGLYYPALTAACALGERMLNHLIIDLRNEFANTPEYEAARKGSFANWKEARKILTAWNVFQTDEVDGKFRELSSLRHRSLHFNASAMMTVREDALKALHLLADIIRDQFGFARTQRWQIAGTAGAFFIKKDAETDPFVRRYYLPQSPHVGPLYAIRFAQGGILFFDYDYTGAAEVSDEEFARLHTTRDPQKVAPGEWPASDEIVVQAWTHGNPVTVIKPAIGIA